MFNILKNLTVTFIFALSSFSISEEVQLNKDEWTRNFELTYLDTIIFSVPAHLVISQGRKNHYVIKGNEDSLRHIKVSLVPGGDLKFEPKEMDVGSHNINNLTVYVTVKDLQKLVIGKFVKVSIRDLSIKKLNLTIQDQAILKADMVMEDFFADINGAPILDIKGSANRQFIDIHGNADYLASRFKTLDTTLNINGSGQIKVKASNRLTVSLVGDAKIFYLGHPKVFEHKISGKGFIRKI